VAPLLRREPRVTFLGTPSLGPSCPRSQPPASTVAYIRTTARMSSEPGFPPPKVTPPVTHVPSPAAPPATPVSAPAASTPAEKKECKNPLALAAGALLIALGVAAVGVVLAVKNDEDGEDGVDNVVSKAKGAFQSTVEKTKDVFKDAKDKSGDATQDAKGKGKEVVEDAKEEVEDVVAQLRDLFGGVASKIGEILFGVGLGRSRKIAFASVDRIAPVDFARSQSM
jgi:uncharacterized protein YjbJ (UPF0337 family)